MAALLDTLAADDAFFTEALDHIPPKIYSPEFDFSVFSKADNWFEELQVPATGGSAKKRKRRRPSASTDALDAFIGDQTQRPLPLSADHPLASLSQFQAYLAALEVKDRDAPPHKKQKIARLGPAASLLELRRKFQAKVEAAIAKGRANPTQPEDGDESGEEEARSGNASSDEEVDEARDSPASARDSDRKHAKSKPLKMQAKDSEASDSAREAASAESDAEAEAADLSSAPKVTSPSFSYATSAIAQSEKLLAPHERQRSKKISTEKKLRRAEKLHEVMEENPDLAKVHRLEAALARAQGVRVEDNPAILKKQLKREEKKKARSEKRWQTHKKNTQVSQRAAQDQRTEHIRSKIDGIREKKMKKIAKKRGIVVGDKK